MIAMASKSSSVVARSPDRRGYTLVELIAVISINSVLIAVAVGLLGTLIRAGQTAQQHWAQTATPARLAAQFRSDVAAAQTATIVQPNVTDGGGRQATANEDVLRLLGPADRTVEFSREGQSVRRIESRGTSVVRREAYAIPGIAKLIFSTPEQGSNQQDDDRNSPQLVTMTWRLAADARAGGESWQITAQLAKDLRFADTDRAHGETEP